MILALGARGREFESLLAPIFFFVMFNFLLHDVHDVWKKKVVKHHTIIPSWIYRIPSELRSQARMGLPSTVVGDHTGIVGVVCFFFQQKKQHNLLEHLKNPFFISQPHRSSVGRAGDCKWVQQRSLGRWFESVR